MRSAVRLPMPLMRESALMSRWATASQKFATDIPLTHWVGHGFKVRDLWAREDLNDVGEDFVVGVAPHSARVYKIYVQ